MRDGFLIKVIPPTGYDVYRLHLSRRAAGGLVLAAILLVFGALVVHAWQLRQADEALRVLQTRSAEQQQRIEAVDHQADALAGQLRALRRENVEIRRLLGAPVPVATPRPKSAASRGAGHELSAVQQRLQRLVAASAVTAADQQRLARLARRVLDLRRLAEISRERMLAALPSINPVDGSLTAGFGWRVNPWPEFHQGVDLAADYGTPVRAAADGVVVSAGWDGGFGMKVAVDHGNGYQTWYAHLSRIEVEVGAHVRKGEPIALVGATGEATGPHLHYQLMHDGTPIDPAPFLAGVPPHVLASLPDPRRVQQ